VTELIASGGGVRNATLMAALREHLPVITSDALGLPAQAKEAYAFAVLGFLTYHGVPATLPSATGARHASLLGFRQPVCRCDRVEPSVNLLRILLGEEQCEQGRGGRSGVGVFRSCQGG